MVIKRRFFTLIEVLIAFALLSLCIIPLLYPSFSILREEMKAVQEMEEDRLASQVYGEILKELYLGKSSWEDLQRKEWHSKELNHVPFFSLYRLKVEESKPADDPRHALVACEIILRPKKGQTALDVEAFLEKAEKERWRTYTFMFYAERRKSEEGVAK